MKVVGRTIIGMLLSVGLLRAQAEEPTVQEEQEVTAPAPQIGEPVKPPRIPGRAQTQEEWDAWQRVVQAVDPGQKADLARGFLTAYPSSGLSSNAHFYIAQRFQQTGDIDNFIFHAEKALEELPGVVGFLGPLAFFYAERGEADKAIDRAQRALGILEQMEKPAGLAARDYVVQTRMLKAESKYALGRAYLSKVSSEPGNRSSDPNLVKAVVNLKEALNLDPKHDYASFRLGFAYRNMNNAEGAMSSYARAVVLGGVAAQQAKVELDTILKIVKEAAPDSEWGKKSLQDVIDEEAQNLEQKLAQQEAEISRAAAELEEKEAEQQQESLPQPTLQDIPVEVVTPPTPPAE